MKTVPLGYTSRNTCRACGSLALVHLFDIGVQYVNNFVAKEDILNGPKAPIELVLCRDCTLVQNPNSAPQELLYSGYYWYRSGVTQTMRDALKDVVNAVEKEVDLKHNDVVLDIGSNDGTLLCSYEASKNGQGRLLRTIGFEPAKNLRELGERGITNLFPTFWDADLFLKHFPKAKAITALGMFYDLEDPNQFIGDIAKALHPEGVFIAQLMCLKNMLNIGDVGNLAHEHLEFYSLNSLDQLFDKHGLEIYNIDKNSVNGESYRLFVRHKGANIGRGDKGAFYLNEERYRKVIAFYDAELGLDDPETFADFFQAMEQKKYKCVEFIKKEVAAGKKVWVYGASTKGNVILQYYGLDHTLIEGAADRSPEKHGKYTIGTGIPIFSEEVARERNPDYFLVLPYAFISEFIKREAEWLAKGGMFILPLPEVSFYRAYPSSFQVEGMQECEKPEAVITITTEPEPFQLKGTPIAQVTPEGKIAPLDKESP